MRPIFSRASLAIALVFLAALLLAPQLAIATTFASVEPVPNVDVVGPEVLANLLTLSLEERAGWAQALLDCGLVDAVIAALSNDGTVTTLNAANTSTSVTTGGFEGTTNPSFLVTLDDEGLNHASAADIEVLVNALGWVLNQGGTIHFDADAPESWDFPLDYITINFDDGAPDSAQAEAFFAHVGTIDEALFSGALAGFTQVGKTLVFLLPYVEPERFVAGMLEAASTFPGVTYGPLGADGEPTTALAGMAFRGNDWAADPAGGGYLDLIPQDPAAELDGALNLRSLRRLHLAAVRSLDARIRLGRTPNAAAVCRRLATLQH